MAASIVVLPIELQFSASVPKRTFDIYNVHQYPVKYVIKTTSPEKFLINTTEGILSPQSAAKVEVTHVDISVVNEGVQDRFRIFFSQLRDKRYQPVGHRDVTSVLLPHSQTGGDGGGVGATSVTPSSLSSRRGSSAGLSAHHASPGDQRHPPAAAHGPRTLYYLVPMAMLVGALWLPTQGGAGTPSVPSYLELSVNSKITIGFVLGILSTLFYTHVQRVER